MVLVSSWGFVAVWMLSLLENQLLNNLWLMPTVPMQLTRVCLRCGSPAGGDRQQKFLGFCYRVHAFIA
jgi:hypothetical protein